MENAGIFSDYVDPISKTVVFPMPREIAVEYARTVQIPAFLRRAGNGNALTISECAKLLGVPRYVVRVIVEGEKVAAHKEKREINGSVRLVWVVNPDTVRAELAKPKRVSKNKKMANFETPPAHLMRTAEIARMTAINPNSILSWVRSGDIAGRQYVVKTGKRHGWQWFAELDAVIALFKTKRAGRYRNTFVRNASIPVTPLIRELWEMDDMIVEYSDLQRAIIHDLIEEPYSTSAEIAARIGYSKSFVQRNLKLLFGCDILHRRRIGREFVYWREKR